ncbi:MAG: nitroreductase family protein [Candidatus Omnitrophota bacterium]|nr:MAG: nitroreductase family protein [Candidatus Omnitrophota bacterium]
MDVFEAIKKRRSIRDYLDKEVEESKLLKVLEAARAAPSANNRQEWRFVVVKDKDKRKALSQAAKNQLFVAEAPLVIACCAQTDEHVMTCGQRSYPIDVAVAIDHMVLTATELGLGTCWIGAFYEEGVKKILDIPSPIKVVELLTLGYSKKKPIHPKERLPLGKTVFFEKWGKSYL